MSLGSVTFSSKLGNYNAASTMCVAVLFPSTLLTWSFFRLDGCTNFSKETYYPCELQFVSERDPLPPNYSLIVYLMHYQLDYC